MVLYIKPYLALTTLSLPAYCYTTCVTLNLHLLIAYKLILSNEDFFMCVAECEPLKIIYVKFGLHLVKFGIV